MRAETVNFNRKGTPFEKLNIGHPELRYKAKFDELAIIFKFDEEPVDQSIVLEPNQDGFRDIAQYRCRLNAEYSFLFYEKIDEEEDKYKWRVLVDTGSNDREYSARQWTDKINWKDEFQ